MPSSIKRVSRPGVSTLPGLHVDRISSVHFLWHFMGVSRQTPIKRRDLCISRVITLYTVCKFESRTSGIAKVLGLQKKFANGNNCKGFPDSRKKRCQHFLPGVGVVVLISCVDFLSSQGLNWPVVWDLCLHDRRDRNRGHCRARHTQV